MPSNYTALGFILQATGENESTWGEFLNNGGLALIDEAIRGRVAFTLSGSKTLTSTNGDESEARKAILHITGGTGGTVVVPNYSKAYFVINEATGDVVITAGGVKTASVAAGDATVVVSDGSNVRNLQIGGMNLKAYIDAQAFASTDLPGINPGTAGLVVGNDGVNAGWVRVGYSGTRPQAVPYTVTANDKGMVLRLTGTGTLSFDPISSLGENFSLGLVNDGDGDITLDPSGAETIDGLASYVMYPNEARSVGTDDTSFHSLVLQPFSKVFTASGTFVKPPGYRLFSGRGWGGGASGGKDTITNHVMGGPGGACMDFTIPASEVAATEAVTIGAGGAPRATTAVPDPGTSTTFGSFLTVPGGGSVDGGGIGPAVANPPYLQGALGQTTPTSAVYGGGTSSTDGSAPSSGAIYGGGGGGSLSAAGAAQAPGASLYGGSGGSASLASPGAPGLAPGGGGGATRSSGSSGGGARGELRLWGAA